MMNRLFGLLLLSLLLCSCAYDPVSGRRDFNIISTREEQLIGDKANPQIKKEFGVYEDKALDYYVNQVGQRVADVSTRDGIIYTFTILDASLINAFALPGGYIYVTRGALAQMNTEAELAFVIGHEISHVSARHGAERLSQQRTVGVFGVVADILAEGKDFGLASDLANTGANLAMLGYGRKNEFEADLIGVEYAINAGYDPFAGARFLHTLKRQEQYEAKGLEWLTRSHPDTGERIRKADERARSILEQSQVDRSTLSIERAAFLKHIEGIYMGDESSMGTIDKETRLYKNHKRGFQFTLPPDWVFIPSTANHAITFRAPKTSLKLKGFVEVVPLSKPLSLDTFVEQELRALSDVRVDERKWVNRGGESMRRLSYTRESTLYTHFYLMGTLNVYVLTMTQSLKRSESLSELADDLVASFSTLPEDELGSFLTLYSVKPGDTLASVAAAHVDGEDGVERLAAFNDLSLEDKDIPLIVQYLKLPRVVR